MNAHPLISRRATSGAVKMRMPTEHRRIKLIQETAGPFINDPAHTPKF